MLNSQFDWIVDPVLIVASVYAAVYLLKTKPVRIAVICVFFAWALPQISQSPVPFYFVTFVPVGGVLGRLIYGSVCVFRERPPEEPPELRPAVRLAVFDLCVSALLISAWWLLTGLLRGWLAG